MCGRFALTINPNLLARLFNLETVPELEPRYNIAPGQDIAAVIHDKKSNSNQLRMLCWGLVLGWSKDPDIGYKMINARSETVHEKLSFRKAFQSKRCLIPTDGFYEWEKEGRPKKPWVFRMPDAGGFALAGLWEHWEGPERVIESCTILTTAANEIMKPVHDRMPVIIGPENFTRWLDPVESSLEILQTLLRPYPHEKMIAYPVNPIVNKANNNDPLCLLPPPEMADEPELF